MSVAGRTIALAVTGSVAAYKAVLVARLLVNAGARVLPMMTASATRFVGPITLSAICSEAVATDMWDPRVSGELHVSLAARADVLAIVPATADVLARLAQGRADDLVTATALCARGPVLAAPAMHPRMWEHPATQRNVAELSRLGRVRLVGPVVGPVASGEAGVGRMEEPPAIVRAIEEALGARDLVGKRIVVSAGPTHEPLDPVRYLANRSTGKMGFAIAASAARRGAEVMLVAGPVALPTPAGVVRHDVSSAEEMGGTLDALLGADLSGADAVVMAAAVADFRPSACAERKIKKDEGAPPTLVLAKNRDLVASLAARRTTGRPLLVAFALETGSDEEILAYAKKKLAAKRVDLVVANAAHESLGKDDNRVALVDEDGVEPFVSASKERLADLILDRVVRRLA